MKKAFASCMLCLALAGLSAGCGHVVSVGHMKRQSFSAQTDRVISLKYWRFEYQAGSAGGKLGLKGRIFADRLILPKWADWIKELEVTGYLCDASGKVLAKGSQAYLPMGLPGGAGIAFDIFLSPQDNLPPLAQLYVSFGYKTLFTAKHVPDKAGPGEYELFVSEGALTAY